MREKDSLSHIGIMFTGGERIIRKIFSDNEVKIMPGEAYKITLDINGEAVEGFALEGLCKTGNVDELIRRLENRFKRKPGCIVGGAKNIEEIEIHKPNLQQLEYDNKIAPIKALSFPKFTKIT